MTGLPVVARAIERHPKCRQNGKESERKTEREITGAVEMGGEMKAIQQ